MVGAGVARKVDFGEGRSRFEASYRHPRHFHLICSTCHRTSEFLSSDVEALMEEIAAARHFTPNEAVVQIHGTCEECRTGRKTAPIAGSRTALLFARDALRMAIATERSGLDFYTRRGTRAIRRGAGCFRSPAERKRNICDARRALQRARHGRSAARVRPTFLFFKGGPADLAAGAEELERVETDEQALLIGIRCESGSHEFFKRYGERFEDSEGKQIFLEFADEEKTHLDLLIGEHRAMTAHLKTTKTR